jgi:hypothetical protein
MNDERIATALDTIDKCQARIAELERQAIKDGLRIADMSRRLNVAGAMAAALRESTDLIDRYLGEEVMSEADRPEAAVLVGNCEARLKAWKELPK